MASFLKDYRPRQYDPSDFHNQQRRPPKYFGKSLDPDEEKSIPPFLSQFYKHIRENEKYIKAQGLFRRNGNQELIDEVTEIMDDGEEEDLEIAEIVEALEDDPHSMAGIIKVYLRQSPEPLLQFALYEEWICYGKKIKYDNTEEMITEVNNLLFEIDKTSRKMLRELLEFLHVVSENSKFNLMTSENLSLIFGPNLLRPKVLDLTTFQDSGTICKLVKFLIENHADLFNEEKVTKKLPKAKKKEKTDAPKPTTTGNQKKEEKCNIQ